MVARNGKGRNTPPNPRQIEAAVKRHLDKIRADAWRRRKAMAWKVGQWVGGIVAGVLVTVLAAVILYHMGLRP